MRLSPIICAKLAYPQSAVLKCRTFVLSMRQAGRKGMIPLVEGDHLHGSLG